MRYALLICTDEATEAARSPEQAAAGLAEYGEWVEQANKRGVLRGGERLRPTADATTVRAHNGEVLTSDGPFAETKEQIGGFFLVDCTNLDEAIELAAKIPGAKHGAVEVRPIWEM